MSFPTILYVEKESGSQTKIENALAFSRKLVLWTEGAYRDSFGAAFMGGALPNVGAAAGALLHIGSGSGPPAFYLTQIPTTASDTPSIATTSFSDEIGHYPWRIKVSLRWLLQFWDAATVGLAGTISATTVSGSPIITVPNAELLTPGQGITATGVPTGSTILKCLGVTEGLPVSTTAIISQNATASATVAATLTGANCLGSFFEDEIIGWGEEISFPT